MGLRFSVVEWIVLCIVGLILLGVFLYLLGKNGAEEVYILILWLYNFVPVPWEFG